VLLGGVIAYKGVTAKIQSITVAEFKAKLELSPAPLLIDVRYPDEYSQGILPGAKLLPLPVFFSQIKALAKDQEAFCFCK